MMDVRPIDANALKVRCFRSTEFNRDTGSFDLPVVPWHDIEDTDTLDYAPVRHGEWVHDNTYTGKHKTKYVCSACAHWQMHRTNREPSMEARSMRYCPNCGAKMDGGKKDV